jgi:hypothetical protein
MRRLRFHIGSLLLAVLVIALGFAALRQSTDLWDSVMLGSVIAALLLGTLLAVHRSGARRAYWLGFTLFGAAYFALNLLPTLESRLPTTKGWAYLHARLRQIQGLSGSGMAVGDFDADGDLDLFVVNGANGQNLYRNMGNGTFTDVSSLALDYANNTSVAPGVTTINSNSWFRRVLGASRGSPANFVRIGHSLTALGLAFLGGIISRFLHTRNLQRNDAE